MRNAVIMNWSPGKQVFDRLALALYKDTMIRPLTISGIPTSIALTSESFSGLNGRSISDRYIKMVGALRPADLSGGNMTPVTMESIINYVSKRVSTHEEITVQLEKIREITTESADKASAGSAGPVKVATMVGKIDEYISTLWKESGIIEFLADSYVVMKDVNDPENAFSLRETHNKAFPSGSKADDIISANLGGFLSGNGLTTMEGDPMQQGLRQKLNFFEYVYSTTSDDTYKFSPLQMAGALSPDVNKMTEKNKAGRKSIEQLIAALTDFEAIMCIPLLKTAVDPLLDESAGARVSDNKNLNSLVIEAERVKTLYELKTFFSLHAWVAMMQMTFKGYLTSGGVTFAESVLPSFAATYDMKGLLDWLFDIPVGPHCVDLLSDVTIPVSATVGGKTFDVIYNPDSSIKHEEMAADMLATFKHVIPMLHSLKNNAVLWDIYLKGGSFVGARKLTLSEVTRNLDQIPVSYVQHGVFSGDIPRSLDDMAWTMMFDWGLNMFNSSARSLFLLKPLSTNGTIAPYAYGTINYQSYIKNLRAQLAKIDTKGLAPSGLDIFKMNLPAIPMKRVMRSSDTLTMWIDAKVANVGPTSMLPVPPSNFNSLFDAADIVQVNKELIGRYETDMESKPMSTMHVKPNKDAKLTVKGSMLNARLGISNKNFTGAVDRGDVLLGRFVAPDNHEVVSCSSITKDDLFIDAINCFYYIPLQNIDPNMSLVYMSSDINVDADAESGVSLKSRAIDVYRIFSDPSSLSVLMVQPKLLGSRLFMDDVFPGIQSPDNVVLDIQALSV